MLAELALIMLHTLDGRAILVNAHHVVTIVDKQGPGGASFTDKVHCAVTLADGKFVTVTETCDAIREKLNKANPG